MINAFSKLSPNFSVIFGNKLNTIARQGSNLLAIIKNKRNCLLPQVAQNVLVAIMKLVLLAPVPIGGGLMVINTEPI